MKYKLIKYQYFLIMALKWWLRLCWISWLQFLLLTVVSRRERAEKGEHYIEGVILTLKISNGNRGGSQYRLIFNNITLCLCRQPIKTRPDFSPYMRSLKG